jgi:hypothetical protein
LKVAWFTSVSGDEPGAGYSRAVLAAMAPLAETLLCCDRPPDRFRLTGIRVLDFAAAPRQLAELEAVDAIFYVLGNDVEQYATIFEMSRDHPGIVVLREATLHRFFLDYYLKRLRRPDLYVARMASHYGVQGLATAQLVLGPWLDGADAHIEAPDLLRYTFTEEALRSASGAVVHSPWLDGVASRGWSGPVFETSLPEGLFTSLGVARDYAQSLLRFAERDVPPAGERPGLEAQSRELAERIADEIGETLSSLGASLDAPGVGTVIREVSDLLWPRSS